MTTFNGITHDRISLEFDPCRITVYAPNGTPIIVHGPNGFRMLAYLLDLAWTHGDRLILDGKQVIFDPKPSPEPFIAPQTDDE